MRLDILYKELKERRDFLSESLTESGPDDVIEGMLTENELCIIRVQQLLLEDINSSKKSDDEYEKFVQRRIKKGLPLMTRTQSEFARFLLSENVTCEIVKTGNMPGMFDDVISYAETSDTFREVWKHIKGLSQE